jgi:xylulokinase
MMEGIAFEYLVWMYILREAGVQPKQIVGQGGACKSGLWNQIKADVLSVPYVTLSNKEQAVMRNTMLAAFGVGDIQDLKKTAGGWMQVKDTFLPVKERNELYLRIFERREKILNGPLREIFESLAELHILRKGPSG